MLKKFVPNQVIKHFSELDVNKLVEHNKKLVLCDIDNTLVAHDMAYPTDEVVEFVNNLKAHNIDILLISNNTEDRVTKFNESLNLNAYAMALKPSKKTYKKIFNDYTHISKSEMISLGDQVLTDVFGSNRMGIDIILTDQIVQKDLIFTKVNRAFESIIVKRLKKKGMWPNEEM